jgi:carnitine O-acetyltransferase
MRMATYVHDFGDKAAENIAEILNNDPEDYGEPVTVLKFPITSELSKLAVAARTQFERTISKEEITAFTCEEWGGDALASRRINAHHCVQLILILAAYRMYGELKPCYEPVSLRSFASGRYASCSMVTEEVLQFCQVAADNKTTHSARENALYAALRAHGKNITRAANGAENTEAHLLALREMVQENEEVPELFSDPMNRKSQRWVLSAAYLEAEQDSYYWGFWQVVEEGFAIGDIIRSDR